MSGFLSKQKIFFAVKKAFNYAYGISFIINVILLFVVAYSSGATPGASLMLFSLSVFLVSLLAIMAFLVPFFYFNYNKFNSSV